MEFNVPTDALPEEVERLIDSRYDGEAELVKARLRSLLAIRRAERLIEARHNGDSERVKTSLRDLLAARKDSDLQTQAELRLRNIRFNATAIGADYYDATGEMPRPENLAALHLNGYSPSLDEIYAAYEEVSDFYDAIQLEVDERQKIAGTRQRSIIAEMHQKRLTGELPSVFFAKLINFKSASSKTRNSDRVAWVEGRPSEEVLLTRYAKYRIACELLPDSGTFRQFDLATKRISIALGVNIHNPEKMGRILPHTFIYELVGGEPGVKDRIIKTEVYQEWEPYLNPKAKEEYYSEIRAMATPMEQGSD